MKFQSLASSSDGNVYIVSDRDTRVLIECGVSHKKLRELTGFQLAGFDAVLVSHEHKDHSGCCAKLLADGVRVCMSQGTALALGLEGSALDAAEAMEHKSQFNIGTLDIVPFTTFHDAKEPLGFLIRSRIDGDILAFATDTVNINYRFPGVNILAIEANFDQEILDTREKIPEKVRHRIANTHMEIRRLCAYLASLDLSQCREIYLLHLSDSSSREWAFINRVRRVVPGHISVTVCPK